MEKKNVSPFFSYNLSADTLSSQVKIKFFAKILCYKFYFASVFHSAQHLCEKREVSGAGSGSVPLTNGSGSVPLTNGSGSGGPKNFRILGIRIPYTASNLISASLNWPHRVGRLRERKDRYSSCSSFFGLGGGHMLHFLVVAGTLQLLTAAHQGKIYPHQMSIQLQLLSSSLLSLSPRGARFFS